MLKNILIITTVVASILTGQILLKKGLNIIGPLKVSNLSDVFFTASKLLQNKFIIFGVTVAMIAAFFWLIVLSKNEMTALFPISGGIFYILLFLFASVFLGESVTILKIIGVAVIMLGILLIA